MRGDHNLCPTGEGTIVGRHGAFADAVRCHWAWATPLPAGLDPAKAGPLFCGGITVFNPFVQFDVRPTQRVGIVGIGGLGHLAVQFANKWGCEVDRVLVIVRQRSRTEETRRAHHVVNSKRRRGDGEDSQARSTSSSLRVNVPLNWPAYVNTLATRGRLHFVGAVGEPVALPVFPMIMAQKSMSGSPLGSPATTADMLEFSAGHGIAPVTEHFPLTKVNDALAHLRAGKARYRIVLENDLKA